MLEIDSLKSLIKCTSHLNSTVFWIRSSDFTKQLFVTDNFKDIYGIDTDSLYNNVDVWANAIDQEQRIQVVQKLDQRRLKQRNNMDYSLPVFYPIITHSNETRFIKNSGFCIVDKQKKIIGFGGTSELITERHFVSQEKTLFEKTSSEKQIDDIIQDLSVDLANDRRIKTSYSQRKLDYTATFTLRERNCIDHIFHGLTARESAEILGISKRTVEVYIGSIKTKLDAKNKAQVVSKALELNLLKY